MLVKHHFFTYLRKNRPAPFLKRRPFHSWGCVSLEMSFTFHSTYMVPYLLSFRFYLEPMVFYLGGSGEGLHLPFLRIRPFHSRGRLFHSWGGVHSMLGWGGRPLLSSCCDVVLLGLLRATPSLASRPPSTPKNGEDVAPKYG